ncbi:MAG: methyltransferase, partial [Pseudomonadota bacterium]
LALVELELLEALRDGPRTVEALAIRAGVPAQRMAALLQAGAALGLLVRQRGGASYDLAPRGAALLTVPGVIPMIRHHGAFYRDMGDPVALLRGEADTELAQVWPYVFGAGAAEDPGRAAIYSQLMADSQALVAEETLAAVSFCGMRRLMDVGGGTGAFLTAVLQRYPDLTATLFDLPAVLPGAEARLADAEMSDRVLLQPGSFRDDPLPRGADAVSLVRVLYDHADDTVDALLAAVRAALPPGGRLIVTEPMAGGDRPHRAGDVYFAFYCMAMRTGRARSQAEIAAACARAGFTQIRTPRTRRRFLTSVVTAVAP